jgi:hypothetical protein
MIWICLVLVVLCIAMACVALWYRKQWYFEWGLRSDLQKEWRITDNARLDLEVQVEKLRSQLPKRDSKGRYCKK